MPLGTLFEGSPAQHLPQACSQRTAGSPSLFGTPPGARTALQNCFLQLSCNLGTSTPWAKPHSSVLRPHILTSSPLPGSLESPLLQQNLTPSSSHPWFPQLIPHQSPGFWNVPQYINILLRVQACRTMTTRVCSTYASLPPILSASEDDISKGRYWFLPYLELRRLNSPPTKSISPPSACRFAF